MREPQDVEPVCSCTKVQSTKKPTRPKLMAFRSRLQFSGSSGSELGTGWRMTSDAGVVTGSGLSVCRLIGDKRNVLLSSSRMVPGAQKFSSSSLGEFVSVIVAERCWLRKIHCERISTTGIELAGRLPSLSFARTSCIYISYSVLRRVYSVLLPSAHPNPRPRNAGFR